MNPYASPSCTNHLFYEGARVTLFEDIDSYFFGLIVQVVLLERVESLGHIGQTVTVKSGYARNFLFPRKKALRATAENLATFESRRLEIEASNLKKKSEATSIATRMDGTCVHVIRQASDTGHLYGAVRNRDISDALNLAGFLVERGQIRIPAPIKTLGVHSVQVILHPEVIVSVRINVAQSEEEALVQDQGSEESAG